MARLFIMNGPENGREYELRGDVTYVGRSPRNDIQIKDKSVSRRHLKISVRKGSIVVEDLNSTNGTFVGSKPIEPYEVVTVDEGTPIGMGNTVFSVGKPCSHTVLSAEDSLSLSEEHEDTGVFSRHGISSRNLELIYQVSSALMESLDLNEILGKVLDGIFNLLKRIDRGAILLLDPATGEIREVISRAADGTKPETKIYSHTIVERAIGEKKAVSLTDTLGQDNLEPSRSMVLMRIRSVMCVPLISRSQVRGVIYVDSINKPFGYRKEDLSLLAALSGPAAIAIENALLYTNAEKLVEERTRSLKDTEKRLRESEARFKAIFDNMSSGVGVYKAVKDGQDFRILDLNRSNQRVEKINKTDVVGKCLSEVFPETKMDGLFDVFERVWRTGEPEHCSISSESDGRETNWREYDVYRLPSKEIVAIFDDVTDKKKAEEEQKALQQQLLVSQKMESIGAFAGGTAHNFRNILQAISGNIEYLELLYGKQPEVRELAKSIYDSVEKGVDLINNLLHFSRRSGGYQVVDLDLAEVIHKSCEIIDRVFNRNIAIEKDLESGLYVSGNQSLLSQVFMNLFTNARDAMPDGGVLKIEAGQKNNKVVVEVSDTGHGMDKQTMEKVFDPFFTLKDVGKGTGLGLSTSHGIVEEHKGTISVSSRPGRGTTFRIVLPFIQAPVLEKSAYKKNIKYGKGEKILIVDDESATLEALVHLANSIGYDAVSFDKARDALENYGAVAPDLVLMDRNMPGMDGATCINEILKTDKNARIIIVSGYEESGPDGIDDELRARIKGYLTKPCGIEELSVTLSQALAQ